MADDESIDIRVRLREAAKFRKDTRGAASEVDNLGDQAAQAARKFAGLNRQTSNARLNLGPLTIPARASILAFGALAVTTENLAGKVLSLGEAAATVGAGGAAAGGVGLTALAQGALVAKLGLVDLSEALAGNEEAIKRLTPQARTLVDVLGQARSKLTGTAQRGLIPGLTAGARAASRNVPVINRNTRATARTLGGLAREGGEMLGSKEWGRDLKTLGGTNVRILQNLGDASLHLADATRHILVEAGPLAQWLSTVAERGALAAEQFTLTGRRSGEMARFFREARRDMELLGSIGAHGGRGLINLFGAQDVDGTQTLRNMDQLLARFERWTNSPAVRNGVGEAIIAEIPQLAGPLAESLANLMGEAAPMAAGIFWDSFWQASAEGKAIMGAALLLKTGSFSALGKVLAGQLGMGGRVPTVGVGKARAVPVVIVGGAGGLPGRGGPTPVPAGKGGWVDKLFKGAKTGAKYGGRGALPASLIAALVLGNNEDYPSGPGAGATRHGREDAGRPARDNRGAFERVIREQPIVLQVDGRQIHEVVVRREAAEHARRGGSAPQGMQGF